MSNSAHDHLHPIENDYIMLIGKDGKSFFFNLKKDSELQTHHGVLQHDELIGLTWGSCVDSHLGYPFYIFKPTLRDVLINIRRNSQIIYPKDIGYILLRLSIGPGKQVIEAGTGSGALTTAFSWAVGSKGHVFSYDRRQDMQDLARKNLRRVGLGENVTFHQQDIADGFNEDSTESMYLDVPNPFEYLPQVKSILAPGGVLGAIVPTSNQVHILLDRLMKAGFGFIEVCEILIRFYKPIPERFRPEDRMIAHTGYLIFARLLIPNN